MKNNDNWTILLVLLTLLLGLATAAQSNDATAAAASRSDATTAVTGRGYNSMESLFNGNKKFREVAMGTATAGAKGARRRAPGAQSVQKMVEQSPSFMFLGCTDNRLTPASIFQSPVGSILTHNNIGNQYHKKDTSTDAAITYAIEDLGVEHIIVLGHYDCKGAARAITGSKERNSISKWVEPILRLYKKARRRDVVKYRDSRMPRRGLKHGATEPPNASEPGFRAFVEENVKATVKSLKDHSILAKAYQVGAKTRTKNFDYEVYVHGFVYDESTGQVIDLQVSFGPPGKPIPPIPFEAAAAAKNYNRKKSKFNKGKILQKPKYIV